MKSRLFLLVTAGLSFGLAQAAAHDHVADRRSREKKEFAFGLAIGLFGPAAAEKMGIPFGETIMEAAIRGTILQESNVRIATVGSLAAVTSLACDMLLEANFLTLIRASHNELFTFLIDWIKPAALCSAAYGIGTVLTDEGTNPITRNMRRGITVGYQLRAIKNMITTEQTDAFDTTFVSVGVLSSLAVACKTAYDFWRR